jgi:hypothetical protein
MNHRKTVHTRHLLSPSSKWKILTWSARFLPLYLLLPHSSSFISFLHPNYPHAGPTRHTLPLSFFPTAPLPPAPFPPSLSRNPTLARRGGMRPRRPPPSPLPFSAGAPRRPGIHDDELAPSNRALVSPSASPPSFSPLHLCSRRIRRGRGASAGPRPARALRIRRWRIQSIRGLLRRRRGGASSSMGSSPRRPRAASSPARRPKMQGHGAPSRPPRAKSLGRRGRVVGPPPGGWPPSARDLEDIGGCRCFLVLRQGATATPSPLPPPPRDFLQSPMRMV